MNDQVTIESVSTHRGMQFEFYYEDSLVGRVYFPEGREATELTWLGTSLGCTVEELEAEANEAFDYMWQEAGMERKD